MSLELNKIAASVLTAGVVAMGSGFVADLLIHPNAPDEPVYTVAQRDAPDGPDTPEREGPEPIIGMIAEADTAAGESQTRVCSACHSLEEGGPNKVGPNLWGVMGNEIASAEGFSYSDALLAKAEEEGTWGYQNMNAFLHAPNEWAPGTKMSYSGLKDTENRANLIAYLRELDSDPIDLPSEDEVKAVMSEWEGEGAGGEGGGEKAPAGNGDEASAEDGLAARLQSADASNGESAARACSACHSFDKGGAHKVGPNLYNVVGADIASKEGYGNYSSVLQEKEGSWTYEKLDAFIENPREWAEGTNMSFAGIGDDARRADIIAYLRSMSDDPPALPGEDADAGEEDGADETTAAEEDRAASENDGEKAETADNGAADRQSAENGEAAADSGDDPLAGADVEAGQRVARACAACHSFEEGGPNKVGPNLHGVFQADIASNDSFNYSNALKTKDGSWTFEKLNAFLENPREWAEGTRMTFAGVKQAEDRKNLIAFLNAQ